jgi:putative membrane protein
MMHGFGFGIGGLFLMVLVWIILIAGAVWLIKMIFSGTTPQPGEDPGRNENAIDILNKRYARGELNREEFEIMKSDLVKE